MNKNEFIEKEVVAKEEKMSLDTHNKTTLRSVLGKEYDYWEREAIREDSHTEPVEGYYEHREY